MTAETLHHDVERAERHMRVVTDDTDRLAQERTAIGESLTKTLSEAEAAEQMRGEYLARIEQTAMVLANLRRDAESESELLNRQRAEAAAAAERRRSTSADLRRLETEREQVATKLTQYQLELTETTNKIDELTLAIEEIDRLAATVDEEKTRRGVDCGDYRAS
jgi:chromosome segregation ATPase